MLRPRPTRVAGEATAEDGLDPRLALRLLPDEQDADIEQRGDYRGRPSDSDNGTTVTDGSEMNKTTFPEATTPLLLVIVALAGCADAQLTFEEPGAAAAGLRRDQNDS